MWTSRKLGLTCCALLVCLSTASAQDDNGDPAPPDLPPCPRTTSTIVTANFTELITDTSIVTETITLGATPASIVDKRQVNDDLTSDSSASPTSSEEASVPTISLGPTASESCEPQPLETTEIAFTSTVKTKLLITTTTTLTPIKPPTNPNGGTSTSNGNNAVPVEASKSPESPPKETAPVQPTGYPGSPESSKPEQPPPKQPDSPAGAPSNQGTSGRPSTAQQGSPAPSGAPEQPGTVPGAPAPQNTDAQGVPRPVPTSNNTPGNKPNASKEPTTVVVTGTDGKSTPIVVAPPPNGQPDVTITSTGADGKPTPIVVSPPSDKPSEVTVISTGADGKPTPIVVSPPSDDSPADSTQPGGLPKGTATGSGKPAEFTGVASRNNVDVQTSLLAVLVGMVFLRL